VNADWTLLSLHPKVPPSHEDSDASSFEWSSLPLHISLPEFHFFHSGVQLLGKCGSKGYLLLELEVPFILYMLNMDISRPTFSLREMSILRSIQELTMARTDDYVCLTCSITNPSVERTSSYNGCMDLFHLMDSSEGLGSQDVDLNVLDGFEAFVGYLSVKIFRLLLVA
jgi:hypothetical protein